MEKESYSVLFPLDVLGRRGKNCRKWLWEMGPCPLCGILVYLLGPVYIFLLLLLNLEKLHDLGFLSSVKWVYRKGLKDALGNTGRFKIRVRRKVIHK